MREIDTERDVEAKRIFVVPGNIFSFGYHDDKDDDQTRNPRLQIILDCNFCCETNRIEAFTLTYKDELEWKCDDA